MIKEQWKNLKVGQIIYSLSNIPRKILKIKNDCVTLKAIRKTKYGDENTVYTLQESRLFSTHPIPKLVKSLFKKGDIKKV